MSAVPADALDHQHSGWRAAVRPPGSAMHLVAAPAMDSRHAAIRSL